MWLYNDAQATRNANALWNSVTTKVVFTGEHLGKGMVGAMKIDASSNNINSDSKTIIDATAGLLDDTSTGISVLLAATPRVRAIKPPTGGVMQFKGLANGTTIE